MLARDLFFLLFQTLPLYKKTGALCWNILTPFRYIPFCNAKRPVSSCETGRLTMLKGPFCNPKRPLCVSCCVSGSKKPTPLWIFVWIIFTFCLRSFALSIRPESFVFRSASDYQRMPTPQLSAYFCAEASAVEPNSIISVWRGESWMFFVRSTVAPVITSRAVVAEPIISL